VPLPSARLAICEEARLRGYYELSR